MSGLYLPANSFATWAANAWHRGLANIKIHVIAQRIGSKAVLIGRGKIRKIRR